MKAGCFLLATALAAAQAVATSSAAPTRSGRGGLHVQRNQLVDGAGHSVLIRGTQLSDERALTGTSFSTIRQRWNMNAVRLPVSVTRNENDPSYMSRVAKVVAMANQLDLMVILAAQEDDDVDGSSAQGMPTQRTVQFWKTWAAFFRDRPMVLFDVFSEPVAGQIPGHQRRANHGGDAGSGGRHSLHRGGPGSDRDVAR